MKYFYDTEFLEDGKTIELISIGIVAEDGREYYAVSEEATTRAFAKRLRKHQWLMDNVVPTLPKAYGDRRMHMPTSWLFDYASPLVRSRAKIARQVTQFILPPSPVGVKPPKVELWADYAAYDHVALCQLFGTMMDLPDGMPMWTHDLEQLWEDAGRPERPEQAEGQHNALEDARWNVKLHKECFSSLAVPPGVQAIRDAAARGHYPLA